MENMIIPKYNEKIHKIYPGLDEEFKLLIKGENPKQNKYLEYDKSRILTLKRYEVHLLKEAEKEALEILSQFTNGWVFNAGKSKIKGYNRFYIYTLNDGEFVFIEKIINNIIIETMFSVKGE